MTIPLDSAYKQLFSHPEIMRDLLSGFVPIPWLHQLDLSAFQRANASYVTDGGPQRHADMVWRLHIGTDIVYIYLLLEFQSRPNPWMALRMQVYVGLLYQDLIKQHPPVRAGRLPPVLPIVLYSGATRWQASLDVSGLVLPPPQELRPFQPELRYLLIDQTQEVHCPDAADGNVVAMLFSLQATSSAATLADVLKGVNSWLRSPARHDLAISIAAWIRAHLQRQIKEARMDWTNRLAEADTVDDIKQVFETWTDRWKYEYGLEGRKQGLAQGLEQGLEQGGLAADRRRLKQHLERRFGALPVSTAALVDAADLPHIDAWFDRSYDAQGLEGVFNDAGV